MSNTKAELYTFSAALEMMIDGARMSRAGWNSLNIKVAVQYPDEMSKMTKPYLYMIKGEEMFPLDLSAESIFAEDWFVV